MRPVSFVVISLAVLALSCAARAETVPRRDTAQSAQRSASARQAFDAARIELRNARNEREQAAALLKMIAAVERFDAQDATPRQRDALLAGIHSQLGLVRRRLGDDRALEAFAESARRFQAAGMKREWAEVQLTIALQYASDPRFADAALQAYRQALTVFTEQQHPQVWALIQSNLVLFYADLPHGDRAENLAQAVQHGEAALRVRTRQNDPINWGITQQLLAYAWLNRASKGRPDDLDRAIEAGENAVAVLTQDENARFRASAQMTLSSAYFERAQRRRIGDLDRSIERARAALKFYTRTAAPDDFAALQLNLTKACRDRHRHADDPYLGCAIDAANAALSVLSPAGAAERWADAQLSLAAALWLKKDGSVTDSRARAMQAIDAVIAALPRNAHPYLWARANGLSGALCLDTIRGSSGDARVCVEALERSLEVWTRQAYPQEWTETQRNIAMAYRNAGGAAQTEKGIAALTETLSIVRPGSRSWASIITELGDAHLARGRVRDVEKAIELYGEALKVLSRADDPEQWGATQGRLGEAYLARTLGVRQNNVVLAIQALEAAAQSVNQASDPIGWGHVQLSLGAAYYYDRRDRRNMELALAAARKAEAVITEATDRNAWGQLNANLAAVYLEQPVQDVDLLPAAIEAATRALRVFDPARNPAEWILTQRNLASARHRSAVFSTGAERQAHLAAARSAYDKALAASPRETRPRERLRTLAGLVQVVADLDDWPAVERVSEDAVATAELLIADSPFEEATSEVIARTSYAASLGALAAARKGDAAAAWQRLELVRARALSVGFRADERALSEPQRAELQKLRERLRALDPTDAPEMVDQRQSIRSEIARLRALALQSPVANATMPELPVVTMTVTRSGGAVLVHTAGQDTIGLMDGRSGPVLLALFLGSLSSGKEAKWDWLGGEGAGEVAGQVAAPVWTALEHAGVAPGSRIVWIPPYQLSHVPLAAASNPSTGESLIDRYEVVQVPSLAAWNIAAARARERASIEPRLAGIFNPTGDLAHADAERVLIAGTVPKLPTEIAASGIASGRMLDKFSTASIWHFATHGQFDWGDFRRSGLNLGRAADGGVSRLTTEDLLYGIPSITANLVLLTVCESGLGDLKENPNELLGLPSAFLQAGAAGVIATMWKVEDLSTALLVAKFYDGYLNQRLPPGSALRAAQRWLRSATGDDLFQFVQEVYARVESPAAARELETVIAAVVRLPADERPYADVKRWGAFIYVGG